MAGSYVKTSSLLKLMSIIALPESQHSLMSRDEGGSGDNTRSCWILGGIDFHKFSISARTIFTSIHTGAFVSSVLNLSAKLL